MNLALVEAVKNTRSVAGRKNYITVWLVKEMRKDWILKEARKADGSKNAITIENPDVRKYPDKLLLEKFWPVISNCLKASSYNYSPKAEIESEISCDLERSFFFMLFDGRRAFYKGKLKVSIESWMIENDFFLPLHINTDPQVVFQILGNSRFKGFPPTLTIDKDREDNFYQIDFHSGNGAGWGRYGEDYLEEKIKKTISANKKMYEFSRNAVTAKTVGAFLTLAYEVYEAF